MMRVYSLFPDGTASEVILELRLPAPNADPANTTISGIADMTPTAERAVRMARTLLTRHTSVPLRLRSSADFRLNPAPKTPLRDNDAANWHSGAGLTFFLKFLATVLEEEGLKVNKDSIVAAVGAVPENTPTGAVGRVDAILERIMAADDALPRSATILLPRKNLDELQVSGELATLDPSLRGRLRGIETLADVLAFVGLPVECKAGPQQHGNPVYARSRTRSLPLWLKRAVLYASAFSVGPLILLGALVAQGRATRQTEFGGAPLVTPTPAQTPVPTHLPEPTVPPTPAPSPKQTPALAAPRLITGCMDFERRPGLREKADLNYLDRPLDLGPILSECQIAFRRIQVSDRTYLYVFSCSKEPFLAYLFPGPATDETGRPAKNPFLPGRTYDIPSATESHSIGALPQGVEILRETIFIVLCARERPDLCDMCSDFGKVDAANVPEKNRLLSRFAQEMGNPPLDARVITIHFNHVSPEHAGRMRSLMQRKAMGLPPLPGDRPIPALRRETTGRPKPALPEQKRGQ
jgi:hypothetical protein